MLYLTRKVGESIVINDSIELTVVEVKGHSVKLGFVFPSNASVLRKEVFDRIRQENIAATGAEAKMDADFMQAIEDAGTASPPKDKP